MVVEIPCTKTRMSFFTLYDFWCREPGKFRHPSALTMEKLRRCLGVFRGAATRLLASANELLQDTDLDASDLQAAIEDLEEKDAVLSELDAKIDELLDDQGHEDKIAGALEYHDKIRHAITKLRFMLKTKSFTPTDVG